MFNLLRSHIGIPDFLTVGLLIFCLSLAWFFPRLGERVFSAMEETGTWLARKQLIAVITVAFVVVALRLSVSPLIPVPFPQVHDEFSYLLAGDTFAHGRLTNPPHPMWLFFDTFHVIQHPTYMSKYPPAQGAVLAFGEIFGHPWIGVLLSSALMCTAMVWALQGWLAPPWAFLGGLIFMFHVGLFSYWMNSYWGGAVAATGGALVIGAFPRIIRSWRTREIALLGSGAAILANSRPFEGLIFCIPVVLGVFIVLWRKREQVWRTVLPRVIMPLCLVAALCGGFMAYYNWRGTGDPLLFPYTLYDRNYLSTPTFLWQTPRAPQHYTNLQFDNFYNGWVRDSWFQGRIDSFRALSRAAVHDVARVTYFFFWPELCFVAPALLFVLHDKKFRVLFLQTIICLVGFLTVPWFHPHYAAPLTCVLYVLLTRALQHVRHLEYRGRSVGVGFSRIIVAFVLMLAPFHDHHYPIVPSGMGERARLSAQLDALPGQQLVIVRYSKTHDIAAEWVYNDADIDRAKIVWAREIPGVDLHPLLNYFDSRRVWLIEPDMSPPRLTPYSE